MADTFHAALVKARGDERSQTDIAAVCKVTQAAVSSWETDDDRLRVLPRAERLDKIAEAYAIAPRRLRALWHRAAAGRSSSRAA